MIDWKSNIAIFREIAQNHIDIKCFAVLDNFRSDFNSTNYGRSVHDAEFGTYWTNEGVTEDYDTKEFPSLVMMLRSKDINDTEVIYDFLIGIAMPQKECDIAESVDIEACNILEDVIHEYRQYSQWLISGGNCKSWHNQRTKKVDGCVRIGLNINELIFNNNNIQIGLESLGSDGVKLKTANLRLKGCYEIRDKFKDYNNTREYKYTTKCDVC